MAQVVVVVVAVAAAWSSKVVESNRVEIRAEEPGLRVRQDLESPELSKVQTWLPALR